MPHHSTATATSGAHAALARHFEQYHERLVAHLASRLPAQARSEPEDAAQQVWMLALTTENPGDDVLNDDGFPAYLGRLIDNLLADEQTAEPTPEELVGFRGHEPILATTTPAPPARFPGVSALSYAVALGDPTTWTADEIEAQQSLAATEAAIPSPAVVTALPRAGNTALTSAA